MMFTTLHELVKLSQDNHIPISEIMIDREVNETGQSRAEIFSRMRVQLEVMEEAIEKGQNEGMLSWSGFTGGDAKKLKEYYESRKTLLGGHANVSISKALAVSETNAGMGRIIATPTAGSAGILPGVLFSLKQRFQWEIEHLLAGVFTASAIGYVIANNASISGASGGCQAEVGSATAMAAGAAVELAGGSAEQVSHAVGIALKNVLGLICDPVAGLVEVPCIVRNGVHSVMALATADMALAGIKSVIPPDEVISTMNEIGNSMKREWKETALGGLAMTPTGKQMKEILRTKRK